MLQKTFMRKPEIKQIIINLYENLQYSLNFHKNNSLTKKNMFKKKKSL